MGIFSKKPDKVTVIASSDYDRLSNRISDAQGEIKVLRAEIESIRTLINSINGRMNRNKTVEEDQQKDLNGEFPFKYQGRLG
jgi:chromosome segregation ATPase